MLLWVIFAGLTAVAVATVLGPLFQQEAAGRREAASGAHDRALYTDQLREIDGDLERGLIGPAEAEAARIEIARRLLRVSETPSAATRGARPPPRGSTVVAVAAVLICLPVAGLVLYLGYGSPLLPDQPLASRLTATSDDQDLAGLVARVEARLREQPEDGEGWDVIAPVYLRQGRFEAAADAYARALRLLGVSTARLVNHGEALVLANNGIVTETAKQAFERALAREPGLAKANFWLAMAAEQDGRHGDAADRWRVMLGSGSSDAPWRPIVEERLRLAEARRAAAAESLVANGKAPARGPSAADIAAAQSMSAEERAAMVQQMVAGLADRLARDGSDLEGWLKLIRSHAVLGDRQAAMQALRSARDNFKSNDQALARLDALAKGLGL